MVGMLNEKGPLITEGPFSFGGRWQWNFGIVPVSGSSPAQIRECLFDLGQVALYPSELDLRVTGSAWRWTR